MDRSKFFWVALVCVTFAFSLFANAICYDTTAGTVKICSPLNGGHYVSPLLDSSAAAPTSGTTINNLQSWIDGSKRAQTSGSHMDVSISLIPGWHNLTEIAFENNGGKLSAKSGFSVFNHEFAYTVDDLTSNPPRVSGYSDSVSSGALPATPGSPYLSDTAQSQVAVFGGQYLYVNSNDGPEPGLLRYSVNGTTGQLTLLGNNQNGWGSFVTTGQPIASDAGGMHLYIGGQSGSGTATTPALDVLKINSDGSNAQYAGPYTYQINGSAVLPDAMVVDPFGKFLFLFSPNQESNGASTLTPYLLSIVRNSDGSLGSHTITSTPQCSSVDTPWLTITPNGHYLLLNCGVNYTGREFMGIQVYSVNRTSGQLTYVNHFATHPVRVLAIDYTGKYVFAAEDTADLLQVFSLNGSTGALTLLGSYPTGKYPSSVAVDVSNNYVYVTNGGNCYPKQVANGNCTELNPSNNINGWKLNHSTGALTTLTGSPFPSGAGTRAMIFIPR